VGGEAKCRWESTSVHTAANPALYRLCGVRCDVGLTFLFHAVIRSGILQRKRERL